MFQASNILIVYQLHHRGHARSDRSFLLERLWTDNHASFRKHFPNALLLRCRYGSLPKPKHLHEQHDVRSLHPVQVKDATFGALQQGWCAWLQLCSRVDDRFLGLRRGPLKIGQLLEHTITIDEPCPRGILQLSATHRCVLNSWKRFRKDHTEVRAAQTRVFRCLPAWTHGWQE